MRREFFCEFFHMVGFAAKKFVIIIISVFLLSCKGKSNPTISAHNQTEDVVNCTCFDGIGASKEDNPILTYTFDNNISVSVCGYVEEKMQQYGTIISEFNIFDCKTGESYLEYGALYECRIIEKENKLEIINLKYLPIGEDWSWTFTEIAKQSIKPNGDQLYVSKLVPINQNYSIDPMQTDEFLNSLKLNKESNPDWEVMVLKLEALSLIGNEEAWDFLNNLDKTPGIRIDGALAETLEKAIEDVKWVRKI